MYSKEDAIKPCPAIARVQASIQTILGLPPQAFMKVLKQLNRTALVVMSVNKPRQTVDFSLVLVNVSGPEEDHPNPYETDRRFKFPMLRVPLEMCEKKDSLDLNARVHPQVALWFKALNKGQRDLLNDDFAAMQMEKKEMEYMKENNTPVEPEQSELKISSHR